MGNVYASSDLLIWYTFLLLDSSRNKVDKTFFFLLFRFKNNNVRKITILEIEKRKTEKTRIKHLFLIFFLNVFSDKGGQDKISWWQTFRYKYHKDRNLKMDQTAVSCDLGSFQMISRSQSRIKKSWSKIKKIS